MQPTQINDCVLAITGGPQYNEGIIRFLKTYGGPISSDQINEVEYEFLLNRGVIERQLNLMWMEFWETQGILRTTYPEMKHEWW